MDLPYEKAFDLVLEGMDALMQRIDFSLRARVKGQIACGAIVFTGGGTELLQTGAAREWTKERL
jgi:hypothetical protein